MKKMLRFSSLLTGLLYSFLLSSNVFAVTSTWKLSAAEKFLRETTTHYFSHFCAPDTIHKFKTRCFERADWMAEELESQGVESSKIWAILGPKNKVLLSKVFESFDRVGELGIARF